jgi:hypothetical protein
VFRVTTIPEEAATEQIRKFTPLASYLEKALNVKVEFTPVTDYAAVGRSAGQQTSRHGLVWRVHLCAGQCALGRQNHVPAGAA